MKALSLRHEVPYADMHALQLRYAALRQQDLVPDTVFFLEHEPVFTRGRGIQDSHLHSMRHFPMLGSTDIPVLHVERGGDVTYHGPGQLVIYLIWKLAQGGGRHDLAHILRGLEYSVIAGLDHFGIKAHRRDGASGVWVGEQKIASLGIAAKKWVTFHGIAINMVNGLEPFSLASPCGYSASIMTRAKDHAVLPQDWRREFELVCLDSLQNELG